MRVKWETKEHMVGLKLKQTMDEAEKMMEGKEQLRAVVAKRYPGGAF